MGNSSHSDLTLHNYASFSNWIDIEKLLSNYTEKQFWNSRLAY